MNYLITGATSGLGFEIYKIIKNNPSNKIYILSKNKKKNSILSKDKNTFCYDVDFRNENLLKENIKKIIKSSKKKIDVLICNVAQATNGTIFNTPNKIYKEDFNVNFYSHMLVVKNIYKIMKKKNFGHIVNISSGCAIVGMDNYSSYSISKSSMQIFMESLFLENECESIAIKNFFPGLINTNFKKKGKNYSKKKKHELYKISDKTKIAKKIFKNLYTKKFNNFFQLAPSLAFSIKNNLSIYKKIKSLL